MYVYEKALHRCWFARMLGPDIIRWIAMLAEQLDNAYNKRCLTCQLQATFHPLWVQVPDLWMTAYALANNYENYNRELWWHDHEEKCQCDDYNHLCNHQYTVMPRYMYDHMNLTSGYLNELAHNMMLTRTWSMFSSKFIVNNTVYVTFCVQWFHWGPFFYVFTTPTRRMGQYVRSIDWNDCEMVHAHRLPERDWQDPDLVPLKEIYSDEGR